MKKFNKQELVALNKQLKEIPPEEIIEWALNNSQKPVVTTNFGPYEAVLLHACAKSRSGIKVIWCDTGYNTPQTYSHAFQLIKELGLNIKLYTPLETTAYRDAFFTGIPGVEDPRHQEFSWQVKLEPFQRAMKEQSPDLWFTNLRKGQTTFRDSIGILSYSKDGVLKISPFYNWSDEDLDGYLKKHHLPNEFTYFDPTKVLSNRECGLHV